MSEKEELDLAVIEARYSYNGIDIDSYKLTNREADLILKAENDIAALVAEVRKLRKKINEYAERDHDQYAPDDLFFPPYPEVKQ